MGSVPLGRGLGPSSLGPTSSWPVALGGKALPSTRYLSSPDSFASRAAPFLSSWSLAWFGLLPIACVRPLGRIPVELRTRLDVRILRDVGSVLADGLQRDAEHPTHVQLPVEQVV
jgi:hypothetical protein